MKRIIWTLLLLFIYFVLYKIYIPRISAFGCFDDCNNFIGGYFVLNGKRLFSEIFFNHQPFAPYISALVQNFTSPQNIFELVLKYRQFILLFGFIFNLLFIFRFGIRVILFTVLFEFSKFYIFGDRFLSENMVVYPIIYIAGLIILKLRKEKIHTVDYFLSAIFSWFVIFSREPFIPLVVFLYIFVVFDKKIRKITVLSSALLIVLSLLTIFSHDVKEYFFDVVTLNSQVVVSSDFAPNNLPGPRIFQTLLYPIYILFFGQENIFRSLLIGIDIVFLALFIRTLKDKSYRLLLFIFFALGLANIRVIFPGKLFYDAFHLVVWYGLFIFITCQILFNNIKNRKVFFISTAILTISFLVFTLSPSYFPKEKINQHAEFINNYGSVLQEGEAIRALSNSSDTLFLDASDDIIYWQAKRLSGYKYSWYTSAMPYFDKFRKERTEMFKKFPPVFYREYGSCPKKVKISEDLSLPQFAVSDYSRLYLEGKPSCIYVRKDKIKEIKSNQWKKAKEWGYEIPLDNTQSF